jgi:hypothetical protein
MVDLVNLLRGNDFNFQENYSSCMTYIFLVLTFCGPIPILLTFLAVFLSLKYWLDKYMFIRKTRIPPQYDS